MTDKDINKELEALFSHAKATQPEASDALLARINADAARLQPSPLHADAKSSQTNLWHRLLAVIPARQSWQLAGGLAAAAIAGVYIGFANPTLVPSLTGEEATADISDLFVSDTALFDEG